MATTTTLRPAVSGLNEAPAAGNAGDLAAFRAGRAPEDRMIDLVAFALAAEAQLPATPDTVARLRQDALTALSDYAFRYVHNSVEDIRRTAIAEHAAQRPRPTSFLRLVLANLVALAAAGLVGGWLALHPETLAGIAGLLAG
jgi:hypothetical protein